MKNRLPFGIGLTLLLMIGVGHGDDKSDEDYRAAQLNQMKAIAEQFSIEVKSEAKPVTSKLMLKPLLRYNDPTRRQLDESTLWLWTERQRPCALMAVEFYPNSPHGPRWLFEVVSLADSKIGITRGDNWKWQAKQPGVVRRPIPDSSEPSDKAAQRLSQARQIRQRFTAREKEGSDGRIELRPLSSPIYRYKDEQSGLIDGMIFAFANGTNPEVLLLLEAQLETESKNAIWKYGFAQMSGADVSASFDDKEVWKQSEADPPAVRDSYVNGWLADDAREAAKK